MANSPDDDPMERQMFWTNIIGLSIVFVLLGLFAWLYGAQFLALLYVLANGFPDDGH
jgi:hypothetical protein